MPHRTGKRNSKWGYKKFQEEELRPVHEEAFGTPLHWEWAGTLLEETKELKDHTCFPARDH